MIMNEVGLTAVDELYDTRSFVLWQGRDLKSLSENLKNKTMLQDPEVWKITVPSRFNHIVV